MPNLGNQRVVRSTRHGCSAIFGSQQQRIVFRSIPYIGTGHHRDCAFDEMFNNSRITTVAAIGDFGLAGTRQVSRVGFPLTTFTGRICNNVSVVTNFGYAKITAEIGIRK